jgi:hypothetical protein
MGLRRRNRPIKTQDERREWLQNMRRRSQPTNLSLERSHTSEKRVVTEPTTTYPNRGFVLWCIHEGLKRTTFYKCYMVKKTILEIFVL